MTLSLLTPRSSSAQSKVGDIYILKPGTVFTNGTDSTYFAIPRYGLEKMLVQARLADTLRGIAQNLAKEHDEAIQNARGIERSRDFWRTLAHGSTAVIVAEIALVIIINR